jgi:hypothetical protein
VITKENERASPVGFYRDEVLVVKRKWGGG